MSRLTSVLVAGAHRFPRQEHGIDDQGYTTHHPLWPEQAEIIYGGLASLIVIGLLIWKAGPLVTKALRDRTDKIQAELDDAAAARRDAEAEAARIRQSLGNIDAERQRLLAEADAQAEALLADGRARLDVEVAELEAKAEADIAAGAGRAGDELRAEIGRLAGAAADLVVERSLDDATQQQLIEAYIATVGATTPATSGATS
jgi:F-type H+-transporting ATPase subunit b